MNEDQHWFLCVVSGLRDCISELLLENPAARNHPELNDGPKKIIRAIFLDSMRNVKKYAKRTDIIKKYLVCEAKTNYPDDAHILPCLSERISVSAPQVPQQNDASSCGLFMLEFIERLMTDSYYLEARLNDESGDLDKWFLASDVN